MQEPTTEEPTQPPNTELPKTFEGKYYAEGDKVIFEIKPYIKLFLTGESAEQMARELKKAIKKARIA